MSDAEHKFLVQSGKDFFCIHGHKQHYKPGKSDLQKAQEELENIRREKNRAIQNAAYWRERTNQAEETGKRTAAALRGTVTKLKNRAAAGLCPCCNRSFVNVARHMKTKHPKFQHEGTTQ